MGTSSRARLATTRPRKSIGPTSAVAAATSTVAAALEGDVVVDRGLVLGVDLERAGAGLGGAEHIGKIVIAVASGAQAP